MLGPGNTKAYAVWSLYPGLPAWRGTWAHLMRQHVHLAWRLLYGHEKGHLSRDSNQDF